MFFTEFGNDLTVQPATASATNAIPLTVGLAGGGYVVIWQTSDGDLRSDVTARVYDAFGNPQGPATTIFNDFINVEFPRNVDVIALPNGGFAVASVRILTTDANGQYATTSDIALQYFTATGAPASAVISASTTGSGSNTYVSQPDLALAGNKVIVTWDGGEGPGSTLNAREFDLAGNAATAILTLDASPSGVTTQSPASAGFTNGSFIEVWRVGSTETVSTTGSGEIRAQLFNADGTATGASFQVNTNSAGIQGIPHVSVLDNGNAIVTWLDYSGATVQIHGQLVSSAGVAIGSEFTLADTHQSSTQTVSTTSGPVTFVNDTNINDYGLTALHDGGFAISFRDGGDQKIYVREFTATGVADRPATLISSSGGNFTNIDALAGGGYQVTWNSNSGDVLAQTIAEHRSAVAHDFNGDGRSDVLLRYTSGQIIDWLGAQDGTFFSNHANTTYSLPSEWKVAGSADFNGDGKADLILRNDNGTLTEWTGTAAGGFNWNQAATYGLDAGWTVAAAGDINGDGRGDLVLRYTNGTVIDWLGNADGTFTSNHANATYALPTDWKIAGMGDFNGDGKADLLLRNDNGGITEWLGTANGGFNWNQAANYGVDAGWTVAAVTDVNGDGRDDVVLRYSTGAVIDWLANADGTFFSNHANATYALPTAWHIAQSGDYNGDGRGDLLLRNDDGTVTEWLGTTTGGFDWNQQATYGLNNGWHIF